MNRRPLSVLCALPLIFVFTNWAWSSPATPTKLKEPCVLSGGHALELYGQCYANAFSARVGEARVLIEVSYDERAGTLAIKVEHQAGFEVLARELGEGLTELLQAKAKKLGVESVTPLVQIKAQKK